MQQVTEAHLVIAQQPQKIIRTYNIPISVIVAMINEATEQTNNLFDTSRDQTMEEAHLSPTSSFFAARKHRYHNNVYVVRIQFRFVREAVAKNTSSVVVFHVEVVAEKDYRAVLPF